RPDGVDAGEVADLGGDVLVDRRVVEHDAIVVDLVVTLEEAELRSGIGARLQRVDLVGGHRLTERMAAADLFGEIEHAQAQPESDDQEDDERNAVAKEGEHAGSGPIWLT